MPVQKHLYHPDTAFCAKPKMDWKNHDIAIVGRVLYKDEECVRYEGKLTLCDLCPTLIPPLRLCGVHVAGIFPLHSPCSCLQDDCVRLLLRCNVIDSCGREGIGSAQIDVRVRPVSCCTAGGQVQRGAAVNIIHAEMFHHYTASVCLNIRLLTLVTGAPHLSRTNECSCERPPLPLYPRICSPQKSSGQKWTRR